MLVSGDCAMTTFDWILVVLIALMAWQGARSGLIGGVMSLVGFVAGALIAAKLAPLVLPAGDQSPYAPLVALVGAAAGGAGLASILERVGLGLRKLLPIPLLGMADSGLGAILGLLVGLTVVWLAAVVVVQLPGTEGVRGEIRASKVISTLGDIAPPTEKLIGALQAFDPLPSVRGLTPVTVGKPDSRLSTDPHLRAIHSSVVRIRASSCGFSVEGSGWVAAPGLVVTNAHVVAGDSHPVVEEGSDGSTRSGQILTFNRVDDLAILRVDGLRARPLRMVGNPEAGSTAVLLGYPLDGPFTVTPARMGRTLVALTNDAYGRGPFRREITILRGKVRPGNSGGPVVNSSGSVVGTVFGRTTSGGPDGGFSIPPERVQRELKRATSGERDPTGPCGR